MPLTRLCVPCLLAMCGFLLPAAAHAELLEQEMLDEINRVRAKHELRPLRPSPALEHSAFAYAGRLMRTDRFRHDPSIIAESGFRGLGEALALHSGRQLRRARTVRRWMHSAHHRALILSRRFGTAGAGHARGRFRGRRATVWVLRLRSRAAQAAASRPPLGSPN